MSFRVLRPETWSLLQRWGLRSKERLAFLFLEAGPLTHFSGLFSCPLVDLAVGAGISEREAQTAIAKLTTSGLVVFDSARFLVFVPGLVERQLGTERFNVKHRAGMLAHVIHLSKDSPAVRAFFAAYGECLGAGTDELNAKVYPVSDTPSDKVSDTPFCSDVDGGERGEEKNILSCTESVDAMIPFAEIIAYLNRRAGTNYRPTTKTTQRLIRARWREGWRKSDFLKVIDSKVDAWQADPKMTQYLRPETLFGPKFESYTNAAQTKFVGTDTAGRPLVELR